MKKLEFNSQICTTREQSQRLLDMGLKPETADMVYHFTGSSIEAIQWELQTKPPTLRGGFWTKKRIEGLARRGESGEEVFDRIWGKDVPAWSLSRLLELMPKRIERIDESDYILWITNNNQYWDVSYMEDVDDNVCDCLYSTCGDDLIEACVFMVELLIRNNYFNKKTIYNEKERICRRRSIPVRTEKAESGGAV